MAILVMLLCLELMVSLVGNCLVLLVLSCNRQLRSVTNFFIASLAASDLLMSVVCIPLTIAQVSSSAISALWVVTRLHLNCFYCFNMFIATVLQQSLYISIKLAESYRGVELQCFRNFMS